MSAVTVGVGTATIRLEAANERVIEADDGRFVKRSIEFRFDDVLAAVAQLAGALNEPDALEVQGTIDRLRKRLGTT